MSLHQLTLGSLYAQSLRQNASNVAIIDGGQRVTYAQLARRVAALLKIFAARDMRPGHRIGLGLAMGLDFISCYMACHIGGFPVTDLPPSQPQDIFCHRATAAELDTVILDPAVLGERLGSLTQHLPCPILPTTALHALLRASEAETTGAPHIVAVDCPDFATINYSGGTTGKPKAEGFTGAASAALTMIMLASLPYPTRPITVAYRTSAPVIAFSMSPALIRGGTIVTIPDFNLEQIVAKSREFGADILFLATRALYALADLPDVEWMRGKMKLIFHGGDMLVPSRMRDLVARFGPIFAQFYGTSEASQSAVLLPEDHDPDRPDILRSVGRPMVGTELEVRRPEGTVAAAGELGEIVIRSPAQMSCYLGLRKKTAETIRNGWIHTGDVGRMSEEGYLYVVDRTSNAIVAGGRTIYAAEIDAAMTEHPAVSASVTMEISPAGVKGIGTAVVLRPNQSASLEELREFFAARYATVTTEILILQEFPLSAQQLKVDRLLIREMLERHFS
jgi:fatty-acyl-CoA synthase